MKSFSILFGNIGSICVNSFFLLESPSDYIAPTCFFVCFSKAFAKGEYENLACYVTLL